MSDSPIRTERLAADTAGLARAAALLRGGGLVAFGTETVYGLGADATDGRAVARIFEAKGRPRFNPLIVHLTGTEAAADHARMTPLAKTLAEAFWPGPLTLVLQRRPDSPLTELVSAGLPTVALRVPDHPTAQDLLRETGRPLAAPSANASGRLSPTEAEHVLASLDGRIEAVLDSGPCAVGLESTVVDATGPVPVLLRPGGLPAKAIAAAAGSPVRESTGDAEAPTSPGQLLSHYAPGLPLRLNAEAAEPGEVLLGFGPEFGVPNLSPKGDLREAAASLFRLLHALDDPARHAGIAVAPVPEEGLGAAINDRLRRAAQR
jgi:L-threonylcarbamoyladenylate synthase